MSSALYNKGVESFAKGEINWLTDDIRAVGVDSGAYTFNQSHEFLSDVPALARITSAVALANKALVAGACDADDITWPAVSGASIEVVLVYKWGGTDATSKLLFYCDTGTGLPIVPNTGNIICIWDNGANRIFKL